MNRQILIIGAIFGILSVVLGAYGAHGLKQLISPESITTFETGVKYQMYHALMLLLVGTTSYLTAKQKRIIFLFACLGIVLFSGSIYGLSTNSLTTFDFTKIALLTPLGGAFLIASWAVMLVGFIKSKE